MRSLWQTIWPALLGVAAFGVFVLFSMWPHIEGEAPSPDALPVVDGMDPKILWTIEGSPVYWQVHHQLHLDEAASMAKVAEVLERLKARQDSILKVLHAKHGPRPGDVPMESLAPMPHGEF